jgi:hypothetical protein
MADEHEQMRFGADGEGLEPAPDVDEGLETDDGEPLEPPATKGGFDRYVVSSVLQKAVRRSDEEVAAWAAWELQRSGYGWNLWDRLALYVVEDLAAGDPAVRLIDGYHDRLDAETDTEWRARLLAIHAALTAARAESSREATYADDYFREVAAERVAAREADREPAYDFPVTDDELRIGGTYDPALDQHTGAGQRAGREGRVFQLRGARVSGGETGLAERWRRRGLGLAEESYTAAEINHAVSGVDPDAPWSEPEVGTPDDDRE